jgi:hypothetical protein
VPGVIAWIAPPIRSFAVGVPLTAVTLGPVTFGRGGCADYFLASREIVIDLIVTAACGLSCMPVGTFAMSWTTSTGAHSPKIV